MFDGARSRRPRTSARICRQSGLAVPPPEARIWARRRHPGLDHEVQPVAQAERHALEDRPRQVAPVVGEGQADERAARERIGVRRALAGEVGEEEEPVAPGAAPRRRADQVVEGARPGARRPGTSAGCRRPTASPTSCASGPARRGRRRGPGRAPRTAAGRSSRRRPRTSPARGRRRPGSTAPTPTAFAAWSPPPATTGVPGPEARGRGRRRR